ncbi:hypothetical protein [uncultured Treponema sp.]|uniref:hypothetical protein n=1 Tax=uncultured Treponema sp. TaxID=162155 RepID=UPI0025EB463D|nr:hypothetical protein [uncultured Treponema sp.]
MRKKTRFKSLLLDFIVIVLCLSGAAFFAWLFWHDLNTFTLRSDKNEIGIISFKHNIAQRKFDDRVVWERIATGTKLYYGDTIRTSDLAEAILTLADGTVVDLGENTMVQVGTNANGKIQIWINAGDIQIDSSTARSALEVRLDDGSLVNMDAGSTLAARSDSANGVQNIEVKSGNAQILTESGQTARLSKGESVNVEKGREIKKNPVVMIYPPKELKLLNVSNSSLPVRFEWKTTSGEEVTIQTSASRNFTKVLSERKFSDSSTAVLHFENGAVFWRAFTQSAKSQASEGKISVEKIEKTRLVSPAPFSSFKYRTSLPRISFRWAANEYAERYRLLVSSTPDMRSVVTDSEINGTFVSIDDLSEGTYWWQVTPFYSVNRLGYAGASEISSFKIEKNTQIKRPELYSPAENAQLVYKNNINANFIWKSELTDADFELMIARDSAFTNTVYSARTSDTRFNREFTPAELRDGTYYWKIVRHSLDADDMNPESEVRSFRVVRYVIQDNKLLYPPENFSVEGPKVTAMAFMWKLSDEYDKANTVSVIQISPSPAFTKIQIERSTNSSVLDNMSLPAGNYWWRVGVRDENGGLSALTQSRMFTVLSELSPPEIVSPAQNQEIMVYNYAPVTVAWKTVEDAESYSIKITKASGEIVKQKDGIKDNSAQFVLEDGSYVCSVQAVATETRISVPNERSFSVRAPSTILAQSPAYDTKIQGLSALRNSVVFSWISGKDKVSVYRFILSKAQRDGSLKVINTIETTKNTLSLNRLTEGTYFWKIAASTREGIPVDSKTMRFTVGPTPALSSPKLVAPAANFVMGGDYLKKHRAIEFTWKEVPGATAYTFVLYKREADGTRKTVYSERNTKASNVRIKDLSILDVGTFEWTVTPYSYAKDGYLEQRGKASSQIFRIDFASPDKVEGVKPGKMYGN